MGALDVEPVAAQHVDPVAPGELVAHVHRARRVDDPMRSALGADDGQPPPRVLDQVELDPGARAADRADQLSGDRLALRRADAGDHRQARMQGERDNLARSLDRHPLESHPLSVGRSACDLSPTRRPNSGLAKRPSDPASYAGEPCDSAFRRRAPGLLSSVGRAFPW